MIDEVRIKITIIIMMTVNSNNNFSDKFSKIVLRLNELF